MNNVFQFSLRKFVLVFFNDILVYSWSTEEHLEHLRQVFTALRSHQLFANSKKKCSLNPRLNMWVISLLPWESQPVLEMSTFQVSSHPDTISAYDSRMKENLGKIDPIRRYIIDILVHKRYINDNIDDNQHVEQTRLSLGFFAILPIYQSLSLIYRRRSKGRYSWTLGRLRLCLGFLKSPTTTCGSDGQSSIHADPTTKIQSLWFQQSYFLSDGGF